LRWARAPYGSACASGCPGARSPRLPGLLSPDPLGVGGPRITFPRQSLLSGPSSRLPLLISLIRYGTQRSTMSAIAMRIPELSPVHCNAISQANITPSHYRDCPARFDAAIRASGARSQARRRTTRVRRTPACRNR